MKTESVMLSNEYTLHLAEEATLKRLLRPLECPQSGRAEISANERDDLCASLLLRTREKQLTEARSHLLGKRLKVHDKNGALIATLHCSRVDWSTATVCFRLIEVSEVHEQILRAVEVKPDTRIYLV